MKLITTVLSLLALAVSITATAAPIAPKLGVHYTEQQKELFRAIEGYDSYALRIEAGKPKAGSGLRYFGGPVISNVKIYTVLWGSRVDATTEKSIGNWAAATVNSTYLDWLKEYNTTIKSVSGTAGTNQKIGRGTFGGTITITPKNTSTALMDSQVQTEIDGQIASGVIPKPDANTLIMAYFPPGISIAFDDGSGTSCQEFCAYHSGYSSKKYGDVLYGIMPDLGGACAAGCGSNPTQFDDLTSASSHELTEAITDPMVWKVVGNTPVAPLGWYADQGSNTGEIGDLCVSTNVTLNSPKEGTFVLQSEWDNKANACTKGTYTGP